MKYFKNISIIQWSIGCPCGICSSTEAPVYIIAEHVELRRLSGKDISYNQVTTHYDYKTQNSQIRIFDISTACITY